MAKSRSRLSLWRETPFLGVLADVGNFLWFALRRFINDGMSQAAGALTYSTLLALVPLMVILLAVLSEFPAFDPVKLRIEEVFLSTLVPEIGTEVRSYLSDFTRNASNLTAAGTIALAVTAVLLLSTIESTLNDIWKVDHPRPILNRFLIFWAILTVGPLLLGLSFTLTSDGLSYLQNWAAGQGVIEAIDLTSSSLKTVLAICVQSMAFTLLFMLVPARRVRLRDAALGGVFAGIGFQVLRWGFNTFLTSGSTYATIYGAVAAIPIFLVWIYLSWTVIILGAVLAASFPDWWRRRDPLTGRPLSPAETLTVSVALLAVLSRQAARGGTVSPDRLAEAVPVLARELVVERLRLAGYIVETEDEKLSLARDLHVTTVARLARDTGLALGWQDGDAARPGLAAIVGLAGGLPGLLERLATAEDDILGKSIADLISAHETAAQPMSRPVPLHKTP